MRVHLYERMLAMQAGRRNFMKGAAALAAGTALSSRFVGRACEVVRCYMAHHQGMTLLSIANFLADGVVQEWFHAHPRVMATELLLHEKPVNYLPSGHPAA